MSPLIKNGFLGKEITPYIDDIRAKSSDFFQLSDETNKLSHQVLFKIDAHSKHEQELLVATLYMRIMASFQGVIILAERGMIPQSQVIMRSLLEAMFTLCALSEKRDLCTVYIQAEQKKRLKLLNKLGMLKSGLPSDKEESELIKLGIELKKDIEEKGIKPLNVEQWSVEAGLHDIYLTAYTILCDPVHTNVNDLERYLVLDNDGEIKAFDWGPSSTGLHTLLMTNIECMLVTIKAVCDLFKINKDSAINEIHDCMKALV